MLGTSEESCHHVDASDGLKVYDGPKGRRAERDVSPIVAYVTGRFPPEAVRFGWYAGQEDEREDFWRKTTDGQKRVSAYTKSREDKKLNQYFIVYFFECFVLKKGHRSGTQGFQPGVSKVWKKNLPRQGQVVFVQNERMY